MPLDSKRNEASFSQYSKDLLCIIPVAKVSRCRDLAIFVVVVDNDNDRIDYFTPCACARGNKIQYTSWSGPCASSLVRSSPVEAATHEGLQRSNIFRIYVSFAWFVLSSSGPWVWRMVVIQLAAPSQRSWVMLASFLGPLFFSEKCACAIKRYGKGSLIYRSWLFQLPSTQFTSACHRHFDIKMSSYFRKTIVLLSRQEQSATAIKT